MNIPALPQSRSNTATSRVQSTHLTPQHYNLSIFFDLSSVSIMKIIESWFEYLVQSSNDL